MKYSDEGLTALLFTAEGDLRQALNNLQSTHAGFGFVSADNVFRVCDQPHPVTVQVRLPRLPFFPSQHIPPSSRACWVEIDVDVGVGNGARMSKGGRRWCDGQVK